jgi:DNA invertase Pin-like site-specific DNA recombinase
MAALLIGYARCSTDQQDLTAQRDSLIGLGVPANRIYVDHGLTGTNRDRPGLREALAPCRDGDTLVVTKLDRLARSLPDARAIADELTARHVRLSLGASMYDPNDAVGRLLFNVLAMVAKFEADLIRLRTKEGMRGREGQRPLARPQAQAQRAAGSSSGQLDRRRAAQHSRGRRPVRGQPPDGLPRPRAQQERHNSLTPHPKAAL